MLSNLYECCTARIKSEVHVDRMPAGFEDLERKLQAFVPPPKTPAPHIERFYEQMAELCVHICRLEAERWISTQVVASTIISIATLDVKLAYGHLFALLSGMEKVKETQNKNNPPGKPGGLKLSIGNK